MKRYLRISKSRLYFYSIGGALLGVPKAIAAMTSGEMKDTAELNPVFFHIKENLLSRLDLMLMFRSFGSLPSMFPKGGKYFWGSEDLPAPDGSVNNMISFVDTWSNINISDPNFDARCNSSVGTDIQVDFMMRRNLISNKSSSECFKFLKQFAPNYASLVEDHYSFGAFYKPEYRSNERYWTNPLESVLPNAPSMSIYSLYGVGKPTERSYFYKADSTETCSSIPFVIDNSVHQPERNFSYGVVLGEGDGTVPVRQKLIVCCD